MASGIYWMGRGSFFSCLPFLPACQEIFVPDDNPAGEVVVVAPGVREGGGGEPGSAGGGAAGQGVDCNGQGTSRGVTELDEEFSAAVFGRIDRRFLRPRDHLHVVGKGAITLHVLWTFIAMHVVAMVRLQHGVVGDLLSTSHIL